jgi:indolepyruvate ferredoxin oxidoreductase alpha subunit
MSCEILLGAEAVALGAIHAGLTAAYSYPGTPASEIMESLVHRTLVSLKHVGLNVAADPFMNSALTGIRGGFRRSEWI